MGPVKLDDWMGGWMGSGWVNGEWVAEEAIKGCMDEWMGR